ncbi:MAG: hypothetical protein H6822_30460 [Planctomycetaceae bacterium]|nr:hypothetical protein [Planctomycetales bacterium]MCB9926507.1 hypothetical protein [Planctomycetaceae bacterium]
MKRATDRWPAVDRISNARFSSHIKLQVQRALIPPAAPEVAGKLPPPIESLAIEKVMWTVRALCTPEPNGQLLAASKFPITVSAKNPVSKANGKAARSSDRPCEFKLSYHDIERN